jgi:hypothetical protein
VKPIQIKAATNGLIKKWAISVEAASSPMGVMHAAPTLLPMATSGTATKVDVAWFQMTLKQWFM